MKPCPSCREMLLHDTPQCPSCGFVLDGKASGSVEKTPTAPSDEEKECSSCHEMVRIGLVRCWNCGAFMQEEIAESYRQRISKPRPIIYSVSQEDMIVPAESIIEHSRSAGRHRNVSHDDANTSADDGGELDFELDEGVQINAQIKRPEKKNQPAQGQSGSSTLPKVVKGEESNTYSISGSPAETPSKTDAAANPTEQGTNTPAAEGQTDAAADSSTTNSGPEIAHSEATAGDVLLNVALQEEVESQKRQQSGRRRRRSSNPEGVIVFCPNGHRIEVKERHRGMSGRCPKCKSLFIVPDQMWEQKPDTVETSGASPAVPQSTDPHTIDGGNFTRSLADIALLVVDPQKLKLKPGSLLGTEVLHDIFFSNDSIMLVNLVKKGGLFGGADKKKPAARETLIGQLKEGKPAAELTLASQITIPVDKFREIRVVQPVQYEHESMFAGVQVFGEGRIAIMLPKTDDMPFPHYLSFPLSQFRDFCAIISDLYGITGLGEDIGVPMRDEFDEQKCHYTEQVLHILKNVDYYQADKNYTLQLIGRKCEGCGLIVSEDGRKKEKIGGKTGSGIAKFKCPKCMKPFGKTSLFALVETKSETPPAESEPTDETPTDATADMPSSESAPVSADAANSSSQG
ncbi:MAG: hypothetical protein O2955_01215 [Planctomycetota bacterium]|nr:hypothetical protein [Planctomycetota bacterium]